MDYKWRIFIHNQLANDFNNGFYLYKDQKIDISNDLVKYCIENTKKYKFFKIDFIPNTYNGKIKIINKDCLDLALELNDYNPVLLNMANAFQPGGGYKNGARAQEEQLFRRSCLHLCLKEEYYPLDKLEGIYSPNVVIISRNESKEYKRYSEPKTISIISMAAYNNNKPDVDQNYINKLMYNKIDMIFKIALINKHDIIILSAFGCGAFNNDPLIISNIFKQVIDNNQYNKYFKYILFAILDDHNSKGNYKIFNDTFNL